MLKYARVLIGGFFLIALSLILLFTSNNWTDISLWMSSKANVSFEDNVNCGFTDKNFEKIIVNDVDGILKVLDVQEKYFNCLENEFENVLSKMSMTGISLTLRSAFSTLFEMREYFSNKYEVESIIEKKDFFWGTIYGLFHLRLNNIAVANCCYIYSGYEMFYPVYVSRLDDFLDQAQTFSDDISNGLKSNEGIVNLPKGLRDQFNSKYKKIKNNEKKYFNEGNVAIKSIRKEIENK